MAPYCLTIYPALIILRPNTKFSVAPGTFGQLNPHAEAYLAWLAEGNTPDPVELAAEDAPVLQARIATEAQARLDTFAKSRGYDGILSACTYATSQVPRFRAEGQRCVDLRDQTWARLYEILAEVDAGTRPVPLSLADIEADLPALVWAD